MSLPYSYHHQHHHARRHPPHTHLPQEVEVEVEEEVEVEAEEEVEVEAEEAEDKQTPLQPPASDSAETLQKYSREKEKRRTASSPNSNVIIWPT